jgi:hypothetical protein
MTRSTMLLWSAASGLVVGLLAGVALLALLTLLVNLVPGLSERLVERLRWPVVLLLLLFVPLVGAVLGYLEGRAKMS